METSFSLWALFASAFISATLFPGGSEVALGVLILDGQHSPWALVGVATLGNALGGLSTYLLGFLVAAGFPRERFSQPRYQRVLGWMRRWGSPALLLSWLPVLGDPLCFVAGWLRVNAPLAALFITLGKLLRYLVVAELAQIGA